MAGRRTLKLLVEYDGTAFHGWQVQQDVRTVQGELERAFERITHERVRIQGAARTDAGVHAAGQVASLATSHPIGLEELGRGLNALSGADVSVLSIEAAAPGFCARRSATGKLYRYAILNAPVESPLRRHTRLHVRRPLDAGAMARAARLLEGEHDFSSFRAADCERRSPVLTVRSCAVRRRDDEVLVEVRAPAFLKNMVRIIAGTLLSVGAGRLEPPDVARMLEARDRREAGPTAPARGLVLLEVHYGARAAATSSMV